MRIAEQKGFFVEMLLPQHDVSGQAAAGSLVGCWGLLWNVKSLWWCFVDEFVVPKQNSVTISQISMKGYWNVFKEFN